MTQPIQKAMPILIALIVLFPTSANAASDSHAKYKAILPDRYYDALAICETGGNWNHATKSYTGGLGIHRQTFRTWSNYNSAKGLTPKQQVKVADAIAFRGHTQRNGRHIWRVGVWGWGCVKREKSLQSFICNSRHPLVQRWKRHC
jgi:hypothetical protein